MMMFSFRQRLALTAVLILLIRGARGIHAWNANPRVGPDPTQYKSSEFQYEDGPHQLAVSVHCTGNSMVLVGHADLYGTGRLVTASELRLGPESGAGNCGAVQREDNELVITAGLHECGAKLRVEEDRLVYANTLFHTPTLNRFGIVRTGGVAIPIECHYKRTHLVSSASQSHPVSSTLTKPMFPPEIRSDHLISERTLDVSEPEEAVRMMASVLSDHYSALKLFLDRCEVTLEPETGAMPTCDLINDHWCPAESNFSFLPGADGHVLRVKLNLPRLLRDNRQADRLFLTCWMKTADPVQRNCVNQVCSYMGNSWCSVDGKHKVCECCDGKCDVLS